MKNNFYNNYNILNLYKIKSVNSEISTQILYGEKFKLIQKGNKWWKVKLLNDGYIGYISKKKFIKKFSPTHKIFNLKANIYKNYNKNYLYKKKLTFGSKISLIKRKNKMVQFEKNKWIQESDIKLIKYKSKNYFIYAKKFIGSKYKWGGKSYRGIDCSALVQLLLNFNNKFCPRDTKDQVKYFKKQIKIHNIIQNDLIFWKGHVAIIMKKNKLIHAYGPYKKVILMNIKKTIKKILLTAHLKVTHIKRIYK